MEGSLWRGRIEYFAVETRMGVFRLCSVIAKALDLPPFEFDCENESYWGTSTKDGIIYDVSRGYKKGYLESLSPMVPKGTSAIIFLEFPKSTDGAQLDTAPHVTRVGSVIAKTLRKPVAHYATLYSAGNVVQSDLVFDSK